MTTESRTATDCVVMPTAVAILISSIVMFVLFLVFTVFLHHFYRRRYAAIAAKAEEVLEETVRKGLATIEDFGHPMVLVGATNFLDLSKSQLRTFHEGNRDAHRLVFVDTFAKFRDLQERGSKVIFLSYQWLSWNSKGPSDTQWESMKKAVLQVIHKHQWTPETTYIWLDVLSIPQDHRSVQSLAVDSLYTYAKCADSLVVICPKTKHESTREVADLQSYKSRVWCRVEVLARCCTRGVEQIYVQNEDGLQPVRDDFVAEMVKVFDGQMTCCRQGHDGGTRPCDRLSLILPLLGLYFESLTRREDDACQGLAFFRSVILSQKDSVFPSHFSYSRGRGQAPERRVLFGDLISRVDRYAHTRKSVLRVSSVQTWSEMLNSELDGDMPDVGVASFDNSSFFNSTTTNDFTLDCSGSGSRKKVDLDNNNNSNNNNNKKRRSSSSNTCADHCHCPHSSREQQADERWEVFSSHSDTDVRQVERTAV